MTLPVSGEQHDRAMRALLGAAPDYGSEFCECGPQATPWIECPVHWALAVLERLARQGVVLVEQPRCKACGGAGEVWLGSQPYGSPGESYAPCPRCNGTGRARMVDVNEIVEALRSPEADDALFEAGRRPGFGDPSSAEYEDARHVLAAFVCRRFASEDTAKEER